MKTIIIPLEAPSQNNLGGRTWRARAGKTKATRRNWCAWAASQMAFMLISRATGPRSLHIVAYRKQRCRDIANLIGGMKACIDGLVDAGLLADDCTDMATITYDQGTAARSPNGRPCTVITVEDLPPRQGNNMGFTDTITAVGHSIVPDGHYQTKSLECGLDQYELRADGSLWLVQRFDDDGPIHSRISFTDAVHFSGKGGSFVALYVDGVIVHLGRKP